MEYKTISFRIPKKLDYKLRLESVKKGYANKTELLISLLKRL